MIAVKEFTNGADVLAHAVEIRRKFYPSRQNLQAQVTIPAEHAANDASSATTEAGTGSNVGAETLLQNFKRLTLSRIYGLADADALNPLTMAEIRDEVVLEFRISRMELLSERRHKNIVQPRQALMYLLRKYTTHSLPAIGRFLGGKDHTTVLHGDRCCQRIMREDQAYCAKVEAIEARLQNGRVVQ